MIGLHPVRRRRPQGLGLSGDHERLELRDAPLAAAARNPERQVEVPRAAATRQLDRRLLDLQNERVGDQRRRVDVISLVWLFISLANELTIDAAAISWPTTADSSRPDY
jgi:hypothetical protein